jgi:hypothetical protein
VLRIPFKTVNAETSDFEQGQQGQQGHMGASPCNSAEKEVPALRVKKSLPPESRDTFPPEAGTHKIEINQSVAESVPAVPAVPAEKELSHAFRAQNGQAIENVGNGPEIGLSPASQASERLIAAEIEQGQQGQEPAQASQKPASASPPAGEATLPPEPASVVSKAPGLAAAASRGRWPERAAAIDAETLCLLQPDSGIERIGLPEALKPEGVSLGELAAFAIERRITQLWLHASWTVIAVAVDRMTASEATKDGVECAFAADDALPAPWRSGLPGRLKAWNRITDGNQEIQLIASAFEPKSGWPFGEAKDAAGMLAAIAAFRDATGGFWPRISPPVTADNMLRSLHRGGLDLKASIDPAAFPEPIKKDVTTQCWLRPLTQDERRPGRFVLAADKNADYLAAMSTLTVGFGEPYYVAAPAFDGGKAGYWRARVAMPPVVGQSEIELKGLCRETLNRDVLAGIHAIGGPDQQTHGQGRQQREKAADRANHVARATGCGGFGQDALQDESDHPASENRDGYGERELLRTHGVLRSSPFQPTIRRHHGRDRSSASAASRSARAENSAMARSALTVSRSALASAAVTLASVAVVLSSEAASWPLSDSISTLSVSTWPSRARTSAASVACTVWRTETPRAGSRAGASGSSGRRTRARPSFPCIFDQRPRNARALAARSVTCSRSATCS